MKLIGIFQNFNLLMPTQLFNKTRNTRIMVSNLSSFKKHTVSERMNRLFHALVSPLASSAFLFSCLCCLRVFELWSFKTLFLQENCKPYTIMLIPIEWHQNFNTVHSEIFIFTYSWLSECLCKAGITCNNLPWKIELSNSSWALITNYHEVM